MKRQDQPTQEDRQDRRQQSAVVHLGNRDDVLWARNKQTGFSFFILASPRGWRRVCCAAHAWNVTVVFLRATQCRHSSICIIKPNHMLIHTFFFFFSFSDNYCFFLFGVMATTMPTFLRKLGKKKKLLRFSCWCDFCCGVYIPE